MNAVTRRPLLVLGVTVVLALGGAALALRLEPSAATDTLVDRGSSTFQDTERFKHDFGDEAVVVLVRGNLQNTVLTADLGRVLGLEGCLSGNAPNTKQRAAAELPPVCREIAQLKPAKVVFGPATFINTAVNRIVDEFVKRRDTAQRQSTEAAQAARVLSRERGDPPAEQERLARAACAGGQRAVHPVRLPARAAIRHHQRPADRRPELRVGGRVRHTRAGVGVPKSRFAYLFPSQERGDDHDPAQAGSEQRRPAPRYRADPDRHGAARVPDRAAGRTTSSAACRWSARAWPTRSRGRSSSCSAPRCW